MIWRQGMGAIDLVTADGEVLGHIRADSDASGLRWRVSMWRGRSRVIGRRVALADAKSLLVGKVTTG